MGHTRPGHPGIFSHPNANLWVQPSTSISENCGRINQLRLPMPGLPDWITDRYGFTERAGRLNPRTVRWPFWPQRPLPALEGTVSTSTPVSTTVSNPPKKVTVPNFLAKKKRGEAITMLTAYDYPTAQAVDRAGIDSILVGDSLGMVVLGYESTLPVTMEDMLHHCKAVKRGAQHALLVGDMPFMSYQVSANDALRNAGRFLQESGMDAVKLEGGRERLDAIRAIVGAGIAVMGHIGLTPQSISALGGFRVQGRTAAAAQRLYEDALLLQEAGCFSLVLESVPAQLGEFISRRLQIPTIGIGAGVGCDGQVLVLHDLLGLFDRFTPRFVKRYTELHQAIQGALQQYQSDVAEHRFPASEHTYTIPEDVWAAFLSSVEAAG
jgi:3-methyl-2-oxobutanoate hydroxymethyltransferase